jgi:hypothetical protein
MSGSTESCRPTAPGRPADFVEDDLLEHGRPFGFLMVVFVTACLVWTAVEALLYYNTLKKLFATPKSDRARGKSRGPPPPGV